MNVIGRIGHVETSSGSVRGMITAEEMYHGERHLCIGNSYFPESTVRLSSNINGQNNTTQNAVESREDKKEREDIAKILRRKSTIHLGDLMKKQENSTGPKSHAIAIDSSNWFKRLK